MIAFLPPQFLSVMVLPIFSVKETKTNNGLSVVRKQDWHQEGEKLGKVGATSEPQFMLKSNEKGRNS